MKSKLNNMNPTQVRIEVAHRKPKAISFQVTTTEEGFKKVQEIVVEKFSLVRVLDQEKSTVDLYRYGTGTKMFFIFIKDTDTLKINFMHSEPVGSSKLATVENALTEISFPLAVAG